MTVIHRARLLVDGLVLVGGVALGGEVGTVLLAGVVDLLMAVFSRGLGRGLGGLAPRDTPVGVRAGASAAAVRREPDR